MSIKITIEHSNGIARRFLDIARTSEVGVPDDDNRDDVYDYHVKLDNGHRLVLEGDFTHRYGDDLLTLLSEAIDALGGRGDSQELKR